MAGQSNDAFHAPVLLQEAVDALVTNPSGCYVDATFGRGGHSSEILKRLDSNGRVIALDRDDAAIAVAKELGQEDSRFVAYKHNFDQLDELMKKIDMQGRLDGLLLDLGVSSPQLDSADRGFSFAASGPLDMRMDRSQGVTARDWLQSVSDVELERVLRDYGEERYARRIAKAIIERRDDAPIETTAELAELVREAHPRWHPSRHPATRTFQAIRIEINKELDALGRVLVQARAALKQGGRLVVISFHSLEDRMVKRELQGRPVSSSASQAPSDSVVSANSKPKRKSKADPFRQRRLQHHQAEAQHKMDYWKLIGKAQKAGSPELTRNPRSRSAVLRVAERLAGVGDGAGAGELA